MILYLGWKKYQNLKGLLKIMAQFVSSNKSVVFYVNFAINSSCQKIFLGWSNLLNFFEKAKFANNPIKFPPPKWILTLP